MSVTASTKKRINVTFPESVLDMLESVVPARKRNVFIVEATEAALRRERQLKAIQELSSAWADEDHPDLMTAEDIDRYVSRLRESWMPRSWDEIIAEAESHGESVT